jgi:hypothetical protein
MHFALAAVVLAGVALADPITIYSTDKVTITSCGPEVTNCPATASNPYGGVGANYAAPPASSSPSLPNYIAPPTPSTSTLSSSSIPPAYSAPPPASSAPPPQVPTSSVPASPIISVITISTCVPTVSYSTITLAPSPLSTPAGPGSPTGAGPQSYPIPPSSPSGAGAYGYPAGSPAGSPPAGTGTPPAGPGSSKVPTFTGAASSISYSFLLVGAAAGAAVLFA